MGKKTGRVRFGRIKKVLLWLLAILAVVLCVTTLLHATYFKAKRQAIQPYGQLVPVFDGMMHVYSQGTGKETVVLLPGMGVALPSADFGPLARRLSKDYTVVVIEYFGVGFSSTSKRERNSANYGEEIRAALAEAGYKPPYILMPHSISSVYSEDYAQRYPEEVKAIISLDGTSTAYYAKTPAIVGALLPIAKVQQALGVTGLLGPLVTNKPQALGLGYTEKELDDMLTFSGFSLNDTVLNQIAQSAECIHQTMQTPYPREVPYFKIIASKTYETANKQLPYSPQQYQEEHLKRLGPQAQYTILEGSHFIYQTNVERIAQITKDFLASIK
ncbi:MAG: alpha/beta fold hydrolase [Sphaerochaeta sp.]|uniref:alpha/beta fold hydrolase n=1 Tax=Sphaerochaeta sp. TaxID=1972642 RepID=UPI003D0EEB18